MAWDAVTENVFHSVNGLEDHTDPVQGWVTSAPYMVFSRTTLLVCDLGSTGDAVVAVVPVT